MFLGGHEMLGMGVLVRVGGGVESLNSSLPRWRAVRALQMLSGCLLICVLAAQTPAPACATSVDWMECKVDSIQPVRADRMALVADVGRATTSIHVLGIAGSGDTINVFELTGQGEDQGFVDLEPPLVDIPRQNYTTYVECMVDIAHALVQPKNRRNCLLLVQGTGGVRLLDTTKQAEFVEITRNLFSGTDFIGSPQDIGVLQGSVEAVYNWISSNLDRPEDQTVGVIDVGGSSVQIAYDIGGPTPDFDDSFLFHTTLRGERQSLFAGSFIRIGYLEFRNLLNTSLCAGPLTPRQFDACRLEVRKILTERNEERIEISHFRWCDDICRDGGTCRCSIAGMAQPTIPADLSFTIVGAPSKIARQLGWGSGNLQLRSFLEAANETCATNTTHRFPDKTVFVCIDLVYVYELLVHGLGLSDAATYDVVKFRDTPSGWLRGLVVATAQDRDSSDSHLVETKVVAITVLASLMFVVLGITCLVIRKDETAPLFGRKQPQVEEEMHPIEVSDDVAALLRD